MNNYFRSVFLVAMAAAVSICQADQILEDIVEQAYPIKGTPKLSIRNRDGSIRIYGTETNELKVQAIKKAYSRERLNQISVKVSVQSDQISIDTKYPPRPKWFFSDRSGTVDYVVVLPDTCSISTLELTNGEVLVEGIRGQNVHASLGSGRMLGHNCFGDLHLNVNEGGLDIAYDWWENRPFSVDARVINGGARAFLPGDAAFHLVATAPNGKVANDFSEKNERIREGTTAVDEKVGKAFGPNLQIHATNGNIQIKEVTP